MPKHLFWLALLLPAGLFSQPLPLTLSLFNEATAIPFTRLITMPLHPGIQVGTEVTYLRRQHVRLFQTLDASWFFHRYLAHGAGVATALGYEYRLAAGLAAEGQLGAGYLHTFATGDEWILTGGRYVQRTDKGNARFCPSLTLGLEYYLHPQHQNSPKVFIRYQAWAEYPYSPGFIPVMTHLSLHAGIQLLLPHA